MVLGGSRDRRYKQIIERDEMTPVSELAQHSLAHPTRST